VTVGDYDLALRRMWALTVLLGDDMSRGLARYGLTRSRAHLLWELDHRGPVTQRELAEALSVSARTITGLIDALVATGFVTREPHPADRRATLVTLTGHGATTVHTMHHRQRQFARTLFADMTGEQFDGLLDGLGLLLARLTGLKAHPSAAPATADHQPEGSSGVPVQKTRSSSFDLKNSKQLPM